MNSDNSQTLKLSVHQLVDFLLRKGDIDSRVFNSESMKEGTLVHSLYQSKQDDNYISEYFLKDNFVIENLAITLEGRADGIIVLNEKKYIIDEIKSTTEDLQKFKDDNLEWHLGQAKCYAYMFAKEKHLDNVGVKLTYIKQGNIKENLFFNYSFNFYELEQFIYELLGQYLDFYNSVLRFKNVRNETLKTLDFPFSTYRKGQKELAKYCYSIAKKGGTLFAEAPTGIGKTMSALFPFIKCLDEDDDRKIFYLTAKSSGKLNAFNAIKKLKKNGLSLFDITLTAKDKICFCKGKQCNPDDCIYARGYYSKILGIIKESLNLYNSFDYEMICDIAETYNVCPFELQLDLSLFCDVIICDYNYLFDPISYLKRFFDSDYSSHLCLIDEAHNLVERSRKIYSAEISYDFFIKARKSLAHIPNKKIKTHMAKIKKIFDKLNEFENGYYEYDEIDMHDYNVFNNFLKAYLEESKEHNDDITTELKDFYLQVNKFIRINEFFDENFIYFINKNEDNTVICLLCMDASKFLRRRLKGMHANALFSATLSPIEYYINLLGGDVENDPRISLVSPFKKEQLQVYVVPKISIKYKNRERTYQEVANYIKAFIGEKPVNALIYLPSYEYLKNIMPLLSFSSDFSIHIQTKDMSEKDRNDFLNHFEPKPSKTHIGFAIMGGSFAEGIDLVSDRLSKVLIVGIGLSKINFESNKIANLYDSRGLNGFDYAYLYPGMNKVMQAIGRLIRSETDYGEVMLIDERYMVKGYRDLYQKQYSQYEVVFSIEEYLKLSSKRNKK